MSVALDNKAGSKEQYDNEFMQTVDDVSEVTADHRDGCGFTCSPFSSWG
ncbi:MULTISPECIES: hypothetical protein [Haloferax]|nr:hypothetical protein [Haloferax mediterranei]MDX5989935.1 hypothetical protein [Haloferax mediterranei ATCC 33500]